MHRLLAIFVLFCFAGCTDNTPQPVINRGPVNYPLIDPDDFSAIEKWESSNHNFDHSKIEVVQLQHFHRTLGDSTPKTPQSVAIQVCGAQNTGPSPEQQDTIKSLVENEAQIHSRVREAVYDYYQESYTAYKEAWSLGSAMFGGGDFSDILPEIKTGNELDSLIQISAIIIHPSNGDLAAIGIECDVPWDEEHGIGVLVSERKVAEIGTAHVAYPLPQPDSR